MVRRKGAECCDPCGNDWKNIVKQLWEKYQEIVRGIRADGREYWPDGSGMVELPGILSDIELVDMGSYWNAVIDTSISSISLSEDTGYWVLEVE